MNMTQYFLIFITVTLVVWDSYALMRWGYTGTISYDLLTDAKKRPIIACLIGIVIGHLFWPQPG